jgi:hypothetical protein
VGGGLSEPDAMRRYGADFKLTVHVRLMHALVNQQFETNGRWPRYVYWPRIRFGTRFFRAPK